MKKTLIVAMAMSLGLSGSALAVPTGATWEAVANCTNPFTGEPTGLEDHWKTYDLYVDLEPGDTVSAVAFQNGGGNSGLITDGQFFQTPPPFGSDSVVRNESFAEFSATVPFDTAVALGGETLAFAASMDWNTAGVSGAWFSQDHNEVGGPLFIARITVSNDTTFLGGQVFVSGTGPNGNFGQEVENVSLGVVDIPHAGFGVGECVPSPGAGAVIASAGLFTTRRRR